MLMKETELDLWLGQEVHAVLWDITENRLKVERGKLLGVDALGIMLDSGVFTNSVEWGDSTLDLQDKVTTFIPWMRIQGITQVEPVINQDI